MFVMFSRRDSATVLQVAVFARLTAEKVSQLIWWPCFVF